MEGGLLTCPAGQISTVGEQRPRQKSIEAQGLSDRREQGKHPTRGL